MISVIVPTNRIGGLDVLFDSLDKQTFKDFELILVDGLKRYRPGLFGPPHMGRRYWFDGELRHVPPRGDTFPRVAYCASVNTGIAHARGETVVLLCDYSHLSSECLATHAFCQQANPGPLHLDYNYSALPPLKADLPLYSQTVCPEHPEYAAQLNATTDRYVADLESGKLDPFMWSIFEHPPTEETVRALPVTHQHRPCATREAGDWNWMSCKNESIPTEILLEMNGFDEKLDEAHCYQDLEFSYRLRAHGIEWQNGPPETGMVTVLNPRDIINVKRLAKPISHNQRYVQSKDFNAPVNTGWSLRDWKKKVLGE